ncbi:hypothetical protein HPB50_016665 [Hyalomma asiaticum]|uniref:Uncharacterized protein n=1 Tax=Hyalomma asiaticum TaxID=266040 RepID=A0ACB7TQ85_HYAAI|nr:hypothetical protein HPB50_016665 [Hyalomma asiaticum]
MLCYLYTNTAVWDNWLGAVDERKTLQELTLPLHISTTRQCARFFDALSRKRELKKVRLIGDMRNAHTFQYFCEALRSRGAEEKVIFTPCIEASCYAYAFHFLKYKCFCDVVAFQADSASDAAPLRKFLHQLCSLNHVTSLTVDINPRFCRENLSSAVSDYIRTTTLERLQLISVSIEYRENEADIAWTPIVEWLAINISLTDLCTSAFCMARDDCENLAVVIKYINTIRQFSTSVQYGWNEASFVNCLSQGIRGNYCLVKIKLPDYMDEYMFAVWDTGRRNLGLVASASQHIAASLERVYRHRALLEELAEVQCVSVVEVAAALREQVGAFEVVHDVMRLAGVVKERVACHPCGWMDTCSSTTSTCTAGSPSGAISCWPM